MVMRLRDIFILYWLFYYVCLTESRERTLCFTGSSAYQLVPKDCSQENPSYEGVWYCATMEICEQFKSAGRDCVVARGCATEEQCTNPSSGSAMTGSESITSSLNGEHIVGMKITASCCLNGADAFEDDDLIAADLSEICNPAPPGATSSYLFLVITCFITILLTFTSTV